MIRNWSARHTLAAGAMLILAVNAVALVGVAYNRSGEPESRLVMTEREAHPPQRWGFEAENSGMALFLEWRLPDRGAPAWLDQTKLGELGFDVSRRADDEAGHRHYEKLHSRDVLLVLEFAGPAYDAALERARRYAAERAEAAASNPGKQEFKRSADAAREQLAREQAIASRLFVVDAGLNHAKLRQRYPDRSRYAIVGGRVRPTLYGERGREKVGGHIEALDASTVNVPLELRPFFEGADSRYEVAVAFGKRLEPWLVGAVSVPASATARKAAAAPYPAAETRARARRPARGS